MKQVVFISGGDSFTKREDFLDHLRTTKLHDPLGQSYDLWSKDLRQDLGDDFELYQLTMPNKQNADYTEWQIWFERHFQFLKDGVILVGWSLGAMFLAKYLCERQLPVVWDKLYLLAGPCGEYLDPNEPGNDCGTFRFDKALLSRLASLASKIEIWHSEDDFVVPYSHALDYVSLWPEAKLVSFTDRNHFLQPELPELIASLKVAS